MQLITDSITVKYYKELTPERWYRFTLMEQLANVGTDVLHAIKWKKSNQIEVSKKAFEASLELLDLTISDPKNRKHLKEILHTRETWVDYFAYDNIYGTSDIFWQNYFYDCNYTAAIQKGK